MRNKIWFHMLLIVSVMFIFAGCSSKGAGKTPRETLENMQRAMLDGDGEGFADCFDAGAEQKKALVSLCRFSHAMFEMQDAIVNEYGSGGSQAGFSAQMDKMRSGDWLDKLEIKIEGDKASVGQKGDFQSISLVRKNGLWRIAAGAMMPSADSKELDKMTKMSNTMADACKKITGKIGSDGYSKEKAGQEFAAIMMREFVAIAPASQARPSRRRAITPSQQSGNGIIRITPVAKKKK